MYKRQDHIYTLNHDLKRLEQKQEDEGDEAYMVRASADYTLREDKEVVDHKMINHIDDIIKILKDVPKMTMADIVDAHKGKELQQQPQVTYLVQKENAWRRYFGSSTRPSSCHKSATKLVGSPGYV